MAKLLKDLQTECGATFADNGTGPRSFGNDTTALAAVNSGVALCDRSHWGRLRVGDSDRLRFLHNQTTNQIQLLEPGQGCDTVFVSSTGRTIDLVVAYVEAESVLLFTSPGQASVLTNWMDRYIFFADKVQLTDETDTTVALTLIGPTSVQLLAQLDITGLEQAPHASHQAVTIQGVDALLTVDSGLPLPGFTAIAANDDGATLWQAFVEAGAVPMGEQVWEELRIEQGRPMPGAELTEEYNPLEATLWQAISFDKGCYIGQETIARLNTYQGVKQQLWGLRLDSLVEPGTAILQDDQKIGVLTSCIATANGIKGLGYVRTKAGGRGLPVKVGEAEGHVVDIPFASRGYFEA
jgi:folate-binding protein YgfZ